MKKTWPVLSGLVLLAAPEAMQAQFDYATNSGDSFITITYYYGPGGAVTIPSTINGLPVVSIGDLAFGYCTNITDVTIPNSVTNIGEGAFLECTSLTNVIIPGSVTNIGEEAFEGCTSLTSTTIPASVTNIGDGAFADCSGLTAITVDTNNPVYSSVNGVLFDKSQSTLIEYPGGIYGSYTISDGVTSIGD